MAFPKKHEKSKLEFTPLEFETQVGCWSKGYNKIRIYSVGVWNSLVAPRPDVSR